MSDIRKALIWGIENPPREYTIEEWFIITEFARHVAEHSKESLIEDLKEDIRPIKDEREVKIKFKCPDCKYMANDSGEEPCCDCHDSDKYEENDLWGGEGD